MFCVGHFLIRARNARSVSAKSGTEITKLLGACSEIFIIFGGRSDPPRIYESQTSKISVPDLELADRTFRARVLKSKHGRLKTRAFFYSYFKRM